MKWMGGAVVAAVVALVSSSLAQNVQVSPNFGYPAPSFSFITRDTAYALPTGNYAGGIIDTTNALGQTRKTVCATVVAGGNDMRWAYNCEPTRDHQIGIALNNAAFTNATDTGTGIAITGHAFKDSMYIKLKGTTSDDTSFFIVKATTDRIVIKKPFRAYTASSDSAFTPAIGDQLFAKTSKTLFGEQITAFRSESFSATKPCTATVHQGTNVK